MPIPLRSKAGNIRIYTWQGYIWTTRGQWLFPEATFLKSAMIRYVSSFPKMQNGTLHFRQYGHYKCDYRPFGRNRRQFGYQIRLSESWLSNCGIYSSWNPDAEFEVTGSALNVNEITREWSDRQVKFWGLWSLGILYFILLLFYIYNHRPQKKLESKFNFKFNFVSQGCDCLRKINGLPLCLRQNHKGVVNVHSPAVSRLSEFHSEHPVHLVKTFRPESAARNIGGSGTRTCRASLSKHCSDGFDGMGMAVLEENLPPESFLRRHIRQEITSVFHPPPQPQ